MFNIEGALKNWYEDDVSLPEENYVSTYNYVWNKLFRRRIIDFLKEYGFENIELVDAIENRYFDGIVPFVDKMPWGEISGYQVGDQKFVVDSEYNVLCEYLPTSVYEIAATIYKESSLKIKDSDDNITDEDYDAWAYEIIVENFSSFLANVDDTSKVTLTQRDMYVLLDVYYFFKRKMQWDRKEIDIYENRTQFQSEEEVRIAMMEYLKECEVPEKIAKEYVDYYIEDSKELYEFAKDDDEAEIYLECIQDAFWSFTLDLLDLHIEDVVPKIPKEIKKIVPFPIVNKKIYPNDACPCGSGKKYKKCCNKNK